ncbi:MAG TPA: hypothetical protein EYO97_03975 [Gemmatimonadetes bacterium]|nr:hypothetical protein [Gemmatimonadota bacterium]
MASDNRWLAAATRRLVAGGLGGKHLAQQLTEEDKIIVGRARRIARFLSQPFFVAEVFTNTPGQYVKLDDTIESFERVVAGEFDHLPEQAFYFQGGIEGVIAEGERLEKEG